MTTLTTFQTQKAAEFEKKLAYKFDHKQGCSFFSDTAKGPMCTCGVMKDALNFLTTAIAERDRQWVESMEGIDVLTVDPYDVTGEITTRITAMSPEGGKLEVEEKV